MIKLLEKSKNICRYKAVVFDLDGTLIDSPLCFRSIRRALGIPDGQYILEYLEKQPEHIRLQKHEQLQDIELEAAERAVLFPYVLELLNELETAGVRTGLFTRNCRKVTRHVAERIGIHFEKVITREDARPKPEPEGLNMLLNEWKILGHELLFVGDSHFDIDCGKLAGTRTALFSRPPTAANSSQADYVISCYSQFWHIFSRG